jgi:hypothetical protein
MYLTKKTYVKNWDHQKPSERHEITVKLGGKICTDIKPERISYIVEEVGYWRKSNQIHSWFVRNVQNGRDECQESYVSSEQLKELLQTVTEVLADHSKAAELLPAQGGFFFGSTDYDEYYFDDLEETKKIIRSALADGKNGDFYYRSSW